MPQFSSILIGNESLLIQCAEILLARGHQINAVVSRNPDIQKWARSKQIGLETPGSDLAERLGGEPCDWLLSIANLDIIPKDVLALSKQGAVNFHDGPLPRYAGLNAPVWALLNGEKQHGVTWHLIADGVDEGDIIEQRMFDVSPSDTALSLNTKCYAAAIESFDAVVTSLEDGAANKTPQDLSQRSYFGLTQRPAGLGRLDFTQSAEQIATLVRALDHGEYWNPLVCPKIAFGDAEFAVGSATVLTGTSATPGKILDLNGTEITVATATAPVRLAGMVRVSGRSDISDLAAGDMLEILTAEDGEILNDAAKPLLRAEAFWRQKIENLAPAKAALTASDSPATGVIEVALNLPSGATSADILFSMAALAVRLDEKNEVDIAYFAEALSGGIDRKHTADWAPVRITLDTTIKRFAGDLENIAAKGGFLGDLWMRLPGRLAKATPDIGFMDAATPALINGTAMTLSVSGERATLLADASRVSAELAQIWADRLAHLLPQINASGDIGELDVVPPGERERVVSHWNETAKDYAAAPVHSLFEEQVARTPDAVALVFENQSLSYADLNARANKVASVLQDMGVKAGVPVGLFTRRSVDMLVGALGILKAGGAYVPMDPAYPADRIALYIEDSAAPVIVTQADLVAELPDHSADVLVIDADARLETADDKNLPATATADDLAYLIFTSGSTGRPKGVMVEHRNVANFFAGMDERIEQETGKGVWLAVTSLSFDISVLELFYTLARGYKLVLSSDENRAVVSSSSMPVSEEKMDFSLYYWGNDDAIGTKKYELLLEGAKYADENGFCAIWTPERHFHAFGGPYPNPSVTGAAVASITKNLAIRAGSIVAPLHHPARIAEEWAVIDNLTGGRVGLAMASGWQPDDFILRPENTPPHNKAALTEAITTVRRLWAGEAVEFPTQSGGVHAVVTQPRPISKEMPMWVTTAGNPATWIEAGELGANVLTHLLGQSIDEVAEKIKLYHDALRKAGHDPQNFKVTLMLHTFVAETRDKAREIAREPMKSYLRSAAGLIKQYAWAFPAFKRPEGAKNAFDLDLGSLEPDELEGILDFAFERYFNDSGLFGTVEDCVTRVESLKRIGVNEVACLIEYGIATETVLAGLRPLAEVRKRANSALVLDENDYSIAAQIMRHDVTHLQCTPSMARMLCTNDESRFALGRVKHLLIGGEALPGALVADLARATSASIENMYGPTETTIWSTTETATSADGVVNIGRPIANTQVYVLDTAQEPVPLGVAGELYIGGDGVTRGYWQRPDLTQERFFANPFLPDQAGSQRMYRTGDLVRWRLDGKLEFLGRTDHQVKLRGYRIELGEIESEIDAFPGVTQAVVIAREDVPGTVHLVAYVTASQPISEPEMRRVLGQKLPSHMVPTFFVVMDDLPLTPNRKVDRKALPAPKPEVRIAVAVTPVSGGVESKIGAIWSSFLGVSAPGSSANFFELGGHSLLAVQVHREIRDKLGVQGLSITDVFRFPTLAAIAEKVSSLMDAEGPKNVVQPEAPERSTIRNDAMSRRREMRAQRQRRG